MPNLRVAVDDDDTDSLYSADSLNDGSNEEKSIGFKSDVLEEYEFLQNSKVGGKEEVLVPFYSGELSLQEIRILQKNSRRKMKRSTNSSDRGDKIDNETLISLHRLPPRGNSFCSTRSKETQSLCSPKSPVESKETVVKKRTGGRSPVKTVDQRSRGKSVSYLEQYRKKVDLSVKKQTKTPSICSTVGDTSCCNRSPLTCSDGSEPDTTRMTLCSEDDDEFYRSFLNKCVAEKKESSDSSLYNSCEENVNEPRVKARSGKVNNGDQSTPKKRVNENRKQKINCQAVTAGSFGTLGPDIEKVKQKLDVLNKRKVYGNTVSCKNRLDIIQRRQTYALKAEPQTTGDNTSKLLIPVVTLSADFNASPRKDITALSHNKINKKVHKRSNMKEKKLEQKHNDVLCSNLMVNENTTQILLERHNLEKKMADRIRDQFNNG